jgi:hypothetical protein
VQKTSVAQRVAVKLLGCIIGQAKVSLPADSITPQLTMVNPDIRPGRGG